MIDRCAPSTPKASDARLPTAAPPSSSATDADEPNKQPSPSSAREYYGFALYLSSFVALALYIIWAYLPDSVLISIGITYYPSRYWALVIPIWILSLIPFTIVTFTAINLMQTPVLDDYRTLTDTHARVMAFTVSNIDRVLDPGLMPEIEDVPMTVVNRCFCHDERIRYRHVYDEDDGDGDGDGDPSAVVLTAAFTATPSRRHSDQIESAASDPTNIAHDDYTLSMFGLPQRQDSFVPSSSGESFDSTNASA